MTFNPQLHGNSEVKFPPEHNRMLVGIELYVESGHPSSTKENRMDKREGARSREAGMMNSLVVSLFLLNVVLSNLQPVRAHGRQYLTLPCV